MSPPSAMQRLLHNRLFARLASTRVGIVLAGLVTVQLMLSSLQIPSPKSQDRLPFSENLGVFLDAPADQYWWFWLLAATTSLLALSTLLGATRALLMRFATGRLDLRFWGISLMHLGFLAGLAAHLLAGATAGVEGQVLLGPEPVQVGAHQLRLVEGALRHNPDGSLLAIDAVVEDASGRRSRIGFNRPWFYDGYTRWALVQGAQPAGTVAVFQVNGQERRVAAGDTVEAGGQHWTLSRVSTSPSLRTPMAALTEATGAVQWIAPGWSAEGIGLLRFEQRLVVSALLRRNDGIPPLVVAMLLFCVGIGLFELGRRRA